jgi:hypothetical protein
MRNRTFYLAIALLLVAACSSRPGGSRAVSGDAPSGTWAGDYDASGRREAIQVDLRWEGSNLRGTVHAGIRSLPIAKASFKAETGAITIEFETEGNRGQIVHYIVDGKVKGNTMSGTWNHDDQRGDFSVTKQ